MDSRVMHGNLLYAPNVVSLMENGIVMRIPFENGYTASLVRHEQSYGGSEGYWEIAVMVGDTIVYDTPVASDVLGWLTPPEVNVVLRRIEKLPTRLVTEEIQ